MSNTLVIEAPLSDYSSYALTLRSAHDLRFQLQDIYWKYSSWEDPLSQKLQDWCITLLEIEITDPRAINKTSDQISILFSKILVNSIDRAPLQEPMLVREYVFEKWMLEDCILYLGHSPCDGKEISTFKVHEFAVAILEWAKPFQTSDISLREDYIRPLNDDEKASPEKCTEHALMLFQKATITGQIIAEQNKEKILKDADRNLKKTASTMYEILYKELQKAEQDRKKLKEEFKDCLEHLKEVQKTSREVLGNKLDAANQTATELEDKLTKTQAEIKELDKEVKHLQIALREAQQEAISARIAAENIDSGFCAIM